MPMPKPGAKAERPALPAIEPRAVTIAPALCIIPGAANFTTSQHAVNCTEDEIYQLHQKCYNALANLEEL